MCVGVADDSRASRLQGPWRLARSRDGNECVEGRVGSAQETCRLSTRSSCMRLKEWALLHCLKHHQHTTNPVRQASLAGVPLLPMLCCCSVAGLSLSLAR